MYDQLALFDEKQYKDPFLIDDFVVSQLNETMFNYIINWPKWLSKILFVYGNIGSGKTHLAHIWAKISNAKFINNDNFSLDYIIDSDSNAFIIDNCENFDQLNLLHSFNLINQMNKYLLLHINL